MKTSHHYSVNVAATGLLVLIVLCVFLFLCRVFSQRLIRERLQVRISPSGLISGDIENDPNTMSESWISCKQKRVPAQMFLGRDASSDDWYYDGLMPDRLRAQVRSVQVSSAPNEDGWKKRAWKPTTGLFVETLYAEKKTSERFVKWDQRITAYAGPQGFSLRENRALGRFHDPLVINDAKDTEAVLVYDRKQRCFFRIDFADRQIQQGPEIPSTISILQVRATSKNKAFLSTVWHSPQRVETEQERFERLERLEGGAYGYSSMPDGPGSPYGGGPGGRVMDPRMADPRMMGMVPGGKNQSAKTQPLKTQEVLRRVPAARGSFRAPRGMVFVLSASGTLYELNGKTLQLSHPLGRFPKLMNSKSNAPRSTLAFQMHALHIGRQYEGCVVSTLSRDGMELGVAAFDRSGKLVSSARDRGQWRDQAGAAIILKSVAEVLHPLGLSLLSLVYGTDCEAILGHRALFFQPNSFVVNAFHDTEREIMSRVAIAIFWLLPSLVLGIGLAWLVARDVAALGLSDSAKRDWILAALALGPVAYITYRITRPDLKLVTCTNCGRLRRADQGKCHRCDAQWEGPELAAPAWRVV